MTRLLLCLSFLTAIQIQAKAIDPVEVCQLECIRSYNECLARNAANPVMLARCEAQRVKCLCDCEKYDGGSGGEREKGPYHREPSASYAHSGFGSDNSQLMSRT